MKQFLLKILLFLPIPIIFISINYIFDPAHVFKNGQYEKGIASLSLEGKNITNISEYDERIVRKYYIEGLQTKKDLLVIGSSRLLTIRSEHFPNVAFYNSSVGNPSLEDLITVYWMYRKKNFGPTKIIIGADPWLLNKNNGQSGYRSIMDDWLQAAQNLSISKTEVPKPINYIPEKYLELVSISYFQESINKLIKTLQGKEESKKFSETTDQVADTSVMLSDGSINFSRRLRLATVAEVNEMAIIYAQNNPVYGLGNYQMLDTTLEEDFTKFINLVNGDGNEIILYLPPYHPLTYSLLTSNEKYRIIIDAQEYFKKVSADKNIKLVGSYNPKDLNLNKSDFYDAMHVKETGIEKVLKDI